MSPLLVLLLACAAPTLRSAHSLDQGEVAMGLAAYGRYSVLDAQLQASDGQLYPAPATLSGPEDVSHLNLELRAGLGWGLEIGTRGLPFASATDLKWSFLDERRHDTPLSAALDLEVGLDTQWVLRPRLGLLLSRTQPLGPAVAVEPAVGAWVGPGGFGYRSRLDPVFQSGSGPATLEVETTALGMALPAGLALPVRIPDTHLAVAPWFAWVSWWGLDGVVVGDGVSDLRCDGCSAGIVSLDPTYGAFLWGGLRVQPWLEPARSPR